MATNHKNEDCPTVAEQHREYLYGLLDLRAEQLESRNRPDDSELAELTQIEEILARYHIEIERDQRKTRHRIN